MRAAIPYRLRRGGGPLRAGACGRRSGGGREGLQQVQDLPRITAADGTVIQKGGKVGPNLYGVVGRQAGTYPDFKYGPSMVEAGEKGLVWDETTIADYIRIRASS